MSNTRGVQVINWLERQHALVPSSQVQREEAALEIDRMFDNRDSQWATALLASEQKRDGALTWLSARESVIALAKEWEDRLSKCVGYPSCDGDLPGEEHSEACPEKNRPAYVNSYGKLAARELRELVVKLDQVDAGTLAGIKEAVK